MTTRVPIPMYMWEWFPDAGVRNPFAARRGVAPRVGARSVAGRMFVLDLDIWIRTLMKVAGARAAGRGLELLLFGRRLLSSGASRPLVGGCGLPVGFDSSDLGEVSGLGGLVAMGFRRRFSAAFRRDQAEDRRFASPAQARRR